MNLISCICYAFAAGLMPPADFPGVQLSPRAWYGLENELAVITEAATANGISYGDDLFLILCAIRKQENGADHLAFGIIHPKAQRQIEADPRRAYRIQAGWAAATVRKNFGRYVRAGRPGNFVDYLADRYCPASVDPVGNSNWKRNVSAWFNKLRYQI